MIIPARRIKPDCDIIANLSVCGAAVDRHCRSNFADIECTKANSASGPRRASSQSRQWSWRKPAKNAAGRARPPAVGMFSGRCVLAAPDPQMASCRMIHRHAPLPGIEGDFARGRKPAGKALDWATSRPRGFRATFSGRHRVGHRSRHPPVGAERWADDATGHLRSRRSHASGRATAPNGLPLTPL
jgi:hypothetical protein